MLGAVSEAAFQALAEPRRREILRLVPRPPPSAHPTPGPVPPPPPGLPHPPNGRTAPRPGAVPVAGARGRWVAIGWGWEAAARLPAGASTVEIRLAAERGGTRVELEHRDLPPAEQPGHASGWTHYLTRLRITAAGQDPGPDPGMPDAAPASEGHLRS